MAKKKKKNKGGSSALSLFNQFQKNERKWQNQVNVQQMDYNSAEAQKNRDWQEEMSNSAHQREVFDLQSAGLNPVLSAGAGAPSYAGSSASASPESANSAISSLFGGLMNFMGSELSASASRYATDKKAETDKYEADLQAQTQKEIAEKNRQAQLEIAQIQSEASMYSSDAQKWIAMHKPSTNLFSLLDKYFGSNSQSNRSSIASQITKKFNVSKEMFPGLFKVLGSFQKAKTKTWKKFFGMD